MSSAYLKKKLTRLPQNIKLNIFSQLKIFCLLYNLEFIDHAINKIELNIENIDIRFEMYVVFDK